MTINELTEKLRMFAKERDWEQFHSPKNLSMALAVETAKLMEHFQWLTKDQSLNLEKTTLEKVKQEIGDTPDLSARLADQLGIDPLQAAEEKLKMNAAKYPVDKAKGSAKKYTDL